MRVSGQANFLDKWKMPGGFRSSDSRLSRARDSPVLYRVPRSGPGEPAFLRQGLQLPPCYDKILVRSRAPCNGRLQTPPGPEGSNGSGAVRVPRITRGLACCPCSPDTHPMYQVIARKYRPQTFPRRGQPGTRQDHPGKRHRAETHRATATFFRASAAPAKPPSRAFWRAA